MGAGNTDTSNVDSWYGVQDPRKRKRIQDRLAQRARRRRMTDAGARTEKALVVRHATFNILEPSPTREANVVAPSWESTKSSRNASLCGPSSFFLSKSVSDRRPVTTNQVFWHPSFLSSSPSKEKPTSDASIPVDSISLSTNIKAAHPGFCPSPRSTPAVTPSPYDQQHLKAPRIDIVVALGVCGSLLGLACSQIILRSSRQHPGVPDILHPSPLQLTAPHYSWIDRFPFPRMRDNLILLAHIINLDEFLKDVFDMDTFTIKEGGVPWDPTTWQLGSEFMEKWGYLFY